MFERLDQANMAYAADKYVNGVLMGSQVFDGDQRTVKASGFLLFADNGFETPEGWAMSSFGVVEQALLPEEVAGLGDVDVDGPFDSFPVDANGVQFDLLAVSVVQDSDPES